VAKERNRFTFGNIVYLAKGLKYVYKQAIL